MHNPKVLQELWEEQKRFNDMVKEGKPQGDEYWAQKYLLGIVGQIGEVLDEIVWKDHRKALTRLDRHSVGRELADITKYTISLWQQYGFSPEDMLSMCLEKTREMHIRFGQELRWELPPGSPVVITDIDGTVGDWRKAFMNWFNLNCAGSYPDCKRVDTYSFMDMETELDLPFVTYQDLKTEFESTGGYLTLPAFPDAVDVLQQLHEWDIPIYAFTARPGDEHSRIWDDTQQWLVDVGLGEAIRQLSIGKDSRIAMAVKLQKEGHKVVLLEDDPSTALRADKAGVPVLLRHYPYNTYIGEHNSSNITRVTTFTLHTLEEALND